ncbi:MAG: flagellar hook-length control protein FliK [Oceanicaulis sp.]
MTPLVEAPGGRAVDPVSTKPTAEAQTPDLPPAAAASDEAPTPAEPMLSPSTARAGGEPAEPEKPAGPAAAPGAQVKPEPALVDAAATTAKADPAPGFQAGEKRTLEPVAAPRAGEQANASALQARSEKPPVDAHAPAPAKQTQAAPKAQGGEAAAKPEDAAPSPPVAPAKAAAMKAGDGEMKRAVAADRAVRTDGARGGEGKADAAADRAELARHELKIDAAAPVRAASRPLAELIALQTQPQAGPVALDGEAVKADPAAIEADIAGDAGQLRNDARGEALRTPGQAGQPARFTPHTVQHLAARIAQTASGGGRTVDIRLDPPELGRVQVRLEMGADNSVRAVLSAERADTLAELQRTARDLERALEEAGLDLAENGLEFSLSQGGEQAFDERRGGFTPVFVEAEALIETAPAPRAPANPDLYGFALLQRARLDMRI